MLSGSCLSLCLSWCGGCPRDGGLRTDGALIHDDDDDYDDDDEDDVDDDHNQTCQVVGEIEKRIARF